MTFAMVLGIAAAGAVWAQTAFEREVRPVLEANCLGCHNGKLKLGGLSMATRADLMAGGKRGPVVMAGDAGASRLMAAVRHEGTLRMPPSFRLKDAEVAAIERWIAGGAAMPEAPFVKVEAKPNHWAFTAPVRAALPEVRNRAWVRNAIDRFVLARLEREGVAPSPEAASETLRRRAALDVTGLLPEGGTEADWGRMVDGLLGSPHFGERWGRKWLDQARYADSDGGSRDEPRQIWRYRDWVIDATNRDMPFDRFVVEQLAGDLLPGAGPAERIATGFHRNSPIQIEAGTDREQYRVEAVVDRVDTTGTVFLGMSVGCARCHDHKFDPISHREYYQLYAIFNSTDDWGNDRPRYNARFNNLVHVQGPLEEFAAADVIARRDRVLGELVELDEALTEYRQADKSRKDAYTEKTEARIKELIKELPKGIEGSMIQRELAQPRETFVMKGGDYLSPGDRVEPGVPAFLPAAEAGRMTRLEFARWLVRRDHPLTARVAVNRIWQEYFGRGLVDTENDFGTQGSGPTHRELLDWLAVEFMESGWSRKHIHRLILNSATYRQASRVREDLKERDPGNLLLARQSRVRLDSEVVRDVALVASGLLTPRIGGPSVYPPQPEAAMSASQVKKTWKASTGEDRYRRGMYTFFWRVTPNPALVVFDAPNSMTACTRRNRSNTPLQALTLLNDEAWHEFATALAGRVVRAGGGDDERIARAFEWTVSRRPGAREATRVRELLNAERDALATRPDEAKALGGNRELAAWTAVARVLLNTDEFITRE